MYLLKLFSPLLLFTKEFFYKILTLVNPIRIFMQIRSLGLNFTVIDQLGYLVNSILHPG